MSRAAQPRPLRLSPSVGPTQAKRARRLALHADWLSITAIAARVGLCRPTVRKYVSADGFPEWSSRRTPLSAGTRHGEYLRTRWEEGVQDALTLWQELQQRGFHGTLGGQRHGTWSTQHVVCQIQVMNIAPGYKPPSVGCRDPRVPAP